MTILFCGGEMDDFVLAGTVAANTTSTRYRTAYARMAVDVTGSTTAANTAKAAFTASATFWLTARLYSPSTLTANGYILYLASAGNQRIRLRVSSTAPSTIYLEKYDGASATTLATSSATITGATQYRLDLGVVYGAGGSILVYLDGVLIITYSGDATAGGSTTLDGLYLSSPHSANLGAWSEVIVSTQDSRTLSLATLAPNAAGTASTWTSGAYTDIDEVTASETDVIVSATANQVFNANTTGMPSGWSNLTVTAIKVVASAARGATGPSKLAVGCRTNSADSFPASVTIDTGYSTPYTTYYEINPVTGVAWTTTEVDAFQIALKSET